MRSRFQMQTCLWVGPIPSSLEVSPLNPPHWKQPLFAQRSAVNFVEPNKQWGNAVAEGIPHSSSIRHRTTHHFVFSVNLDFHA